MTYTYDDNGQPRELLAVEVRHQGRRVGWAHPDDCAAFVRGGLAEAGLLALAALNPEPPEGAQYVGPAPEPFVVERRSE